MGVIIAKVEVGRKNEDKKEGQRRKEKEKKMKMKKKKKKRKRKRKEKGKDWLESMRNRPRMPSFFCCSE